MFDIKLSLICLNFACQLDLFMNITQLDVEFVHLLFFLMLDVEISIYYFNKFWISEDDLSAC